MNRGDEFLALFNKLETHFKTMARQHFQNYDRFTSMSKLVSDLSGNDATVKRRKEDILEFSDLRNALVHSRGLNGASMLAEPFPEWMAVFEDLVEGVVNPPPVWNVSGKNPRIFSPNDSLKVALQYMQQNDYSQIIVQDNGPVRLLTTGGVTHWLEHYVVEEFAIIEGIPLSEVLQYEPKGSGMVVSRDNPIDEVRQWFFRLPSGDVGRLFAVIVTHSGRDTDKPIGIVTPWDLGEV